jgi:hypothetical protein
MSTDHTYRSPGGGWSIIGALLIVAGLIVLGGRALGVDSHQLAWPISVIGPGILVCAAALGSGGRTGVSLMPLGSALTIIGFVLLYQAATNSFESWAYAWALIPTAIGVGQMLFARLKNQPDLIATGRRLVAIGVALFVGGAIFFEGIIGLGGLTRGYNGLDKTNSHPVFGMLDWPVVLLGLGVLLVLGEIMYKRRVVALPERGP